MPLRQNAFPERSEDRACVTHLRPGSSSGPKTLSVSVSYKAESNVVKPSSTSPATSKCLSLFGKGLRRTISRLLGPFFDRNDHTTNVGGRRAQQIVHNSHLNTRQFSGPFGRCHVVSPGDPQSASPSACHSLIPKIA